MNMNEIPEALCQKLRIKIISCLVSSSKTFNELLTLTQTTKGNLSVQLMKLEEWHYITSDKVIENKKSKSTYALTDHGMTQFEEYVALLKQIIEENEG